MHDDIERLVRISTQSLSLYGKCGESILKPTIRDTLTGAGFDVDTEDTKSFLVGGQPVWRDKESGEVVSTTRRRRIDLVVRAGKKVIALIETESDLNHLREHGVNRGSGHYDVFSIARDGSGAWFNSYKSLERMAAAAFYAAGGTIFDLEKIQSDLPSEHNPHGLALILVTGSSRALDRRVLKRRIRALGAQLISVVERL